MGFTDPFRKLNCPFCSEEYHLGDFGIYSERDGSVMHAPPQDFWPRVASRFWVRPLAGRKNVLAQALRQCPNPNCQKRLPFNIEYVEDNITIAVIGDSFSGKSHYIATTIKQLKDGQIPPELGLSNFAASASGIDDRYRNDYYDPLFKRGEPLQTTHQATNPVDDPLIYEMCIASKRVNFLFYDASGEDIANIDTRVQNKPHILNARAIIFLADPWSMPGFVNQLAHHLRPDPRYLTGRTATDVLNRVIGVFKRASNQMRETQFSLPVAIAFSKSDLIPYLRTRSNDPRYLALADLQYPSRLNSKESDDIHAVVRQLLLEVGENSLVAMENTIARLNFSAISATGSSLNDQGKYSQIEPNRCLDPLFWVLRELKVVE